MIMMIGDDEDVDIMLKDIDYYSGYIEISGTVEYRNQLQAAIK